MGPTCRKAFSCLDPFLLLIPQCLQELESLSKAKYAMLVFSTAPAKFKWLKIGTMFSFCLEVGSLQKFL